MTAPPFSISEEDFRKTAMDYLLYERGIDAKQFKMDLSETVLYDSDTNIEENNIVIRAVSCFQNVLL